MYSEMSLVKTGALIIMLYTLLLAGTAAAICVTHPSTFAAIGQVPCMALVAMAVYNMVTRELRCLHVNLTGLNLLCMHQDSLACNLTSYTCTCERGQGRVWCILSCLGELTRQTLALQHC